MRTEIGPTTSRRAHPQRRYTPYTAGREHYTFSAKLPSAARSITFMEQTEPKTSFGYKVAVLIVVVVPFLATIYAINLLWQRFVTPLDVGLMLGLYLVSGLGITIGYHRLLTHRSFETNPFLRSLFLIMG